MKIRNFLFLSLWMLFVLITTPPVLADSKIILNSFSTIHGDEIRLKDIAKFQDMEPGLKSKIGDFNIGNAPLPNKSIRFTKKDMMEKLSALDKDLGNTKLEIPAVVTIKSGEDKNSETTDVSLLVKKGDPVIIEVLNGAVILTTDGKALQGGGQDSEIRVMSMPAGKVINATVTGSGKVNLKMR